MNNLMIDVNAHRKTNTYKLNMHLQKMISYHSREVLTLNTLPNRTNYEAIKIAIHDAKAEVYHDIQKQLNKGNFSE